MVESLFFLKISIVLLGTGCLHRRRLGGTLALYNQPRPKTGFT